MAKLNLPEIPSGFGATEALNSAFQQIEEALENTLSRDGTTPNQLEADLDLNGNLLLNIGGDTNDPNSLVTVGSMQSYVDSLASGIVLQRRETQISGNSQTTFTLTEFEYEAGSNNLAVYVDGIRKFPPQDYTEASSTSVVFLSGVALDSVVEFVVNEFLGTVTLPPHTHTISNVIGLEDALDSKADLSGAIFTGTVETESYKVGDDITITDVDVANSAAVKGQQDPTQGYFRFGNATSGFGWNGSNLVLGANKIWHAGNQKRIFVQASTPTAEATGDIWLW